MFEHMDLTGLEAIRMKSAPLVNSEQAARDLLSELTNEPVIAAGMRHSQGGQTALRDGHMLIMETMRKVGDPYADANAPGRHSIDVEAGATWSDIHRKVSAFALAPIVQQSSAHFTIGGSLSVDCHGRDVRYSSMADTVNWVDVLLPDGRREKTYPGQDLFRTVVGGYGARGLILGASLKLDRNWVMGREAWRAESLSNYARHLKQLDARTLKLKDTNASGTVKVEDEEGREVEVEIAKRPIHMHYAWANTFDSSRYLDEFVPHFGFLDRVSSVPTSPEHKLGRSVRPGALKTEGWGTSEIMRAAWEAAKINPKFGSDLWKKLKDASRVATYNQNRLVYLREDILFTSSKTNGHSVDLLQEYFVPVNRFETFMKELAGHIPWGAKDVKILSCTIRYLSPPRSGPLPYLSYMREGESRISVAVELNVEVTEKLPDESAMSQRPLVPVDTAREKLKAVIESAIGPGDGSFYLPYHLFADASQIARAYPELTKFLAKTDPINTGGRFNSEFLKALREASGVPPTTKGNHA